MHQKYFSRRLPNERRVSYDVWMKAVWERIHFYNIGLVLSYDTTPMPRERDYKIVNIIILHKKSLETQLSLNRV